MFNDLEMERHAFVFMMEITAGRTDCFIYAILIVHQSARFVADSKISRNKGQCFRHFSGVQ